MKCEICGSIKFYIEEISKTDNYDFSNMKIKDIEDNIRCSVYVDYDWTKSKIIVKCSKCNKILIE